VPLNRVFVITTITAFKDINVRDFYIYNRDKVNSSDFKDSSKCV
jgi:hypothetical protein